METDLQKQVENITGLIHFIRGEKVILDYDLARLYGVEVKSLKRVVRRNIQRFPDDFMFELSMEETRNLRYQFGTLRHGEHSKYLPFAFTEQGVAMLSGLLNSTEAIRVNIAIMRAFVQMRRLPEANKEVALKIEELERAVASNDEDILLIFEAIKQLTQKKSEPMEPVGYKIPQKTRE